MSARDATEHKMEKLKTLLIANRGEIGRWSAASTYQIRPALADEVITKPQPCESSGP